MVRALFFSFLFSQSSFRDAQYCKQLFLMVTPYIGNAFAEICFPRGIPEVLTTEIAFAARDKLAVIEKASKKRANCNFLVVDYSKTHRKAWSMAIHTLGQTTSEAMSGSEAVEAIKANIQQSKTGSLDWVPFDVVLLRLSLRSYIEELHLMEFPGCIFAVAGGSEKKVR